MKSKEILLFCSILIFSSFNVKAERYFDEIFESISVTDNVVYAQNFSILTGVSVLEDLQMTIYIPENDTVTDRPLFIYVHSGYFLPKGFNQLAVGTRSDSSIVEICTRLSKRGYVVASIDYRLGWNPMSNSQDERTGSYLRALYRGIQDARTAARYFRNDVSVNNNQYGIDPNRIAIIGAGEGGSIALGSVFLDRQEEIEMPKFYDFTNNEPYINTSEMGDFYGLGGDPSKNQSNYEGYNSNFAFCVNLGGAIADSTWIEQEDVPVVSFHCPNDPFVPYAYGVIIVPTTGDFVMDVSGSKEVARISDEFGNNAAYLGNIDDEITNYANTINNGYEGLYPFFRPTPENAPWEWWNTADPLHDNSVLVNPDMSSEKANLYIDTILNYVVPRAYITMIDTSAQIVSNNQVFANDQMIKVFPNPVKAYFTVSSAAQIDAINISDVSGKVVYNKAVFDSKQAIVNRAHLKPGVYFLEVKTETSTSVSKLVFQ